MSLDTDIKRARDAIKNQQTRQDIMAIASKEGISFNAAMKRYFSAK